MSSDSFTGRGPRRQTRRGVIVAERIARLLISIGGIGTILAVSLIFFFLLWVVFPLWMPAEIEAASETAPAAFEAPLAMGLDESQAIRWSLGENGQLRSERADDGSLLATADVLLLDGAAPTAVAVVPGSEMVALGYPDGRARFALIGFRTTIFTETDREDIDADELGEGVEPMPDDLRDLPVGSLRAYRDGVANRLDPVKIRYQVLDVRVLDPPVEVSGGSPIVQIDASGHLAYDDGQWRLEFKFAALTAAGDLIVGGLEEKTSFLTGETSIVTAARTAPGIVPEGQGRAVDLFLTDLGDHVLVVWADGTALHYLDRDGSLALEERLDLVEKPGATVTASAPLIGKNTLMVGDSLGRVGAWFAARGDAKAQKRDLAAAQRAYQTAIYELRDRLERAGVPPHELPFGGVEEEELPPEIRAHLDADELAWAEDELALLRELSPPIGAARQALMAADRQAFVRGHLLDSPGGAAPSVIVSSPKSRLTAVGTQTGQVGLIQVTSGRLLGSVKVSNGPVTVLTISPKESVLFGVADSRTFRVDIDPGHPAVSLATLFAPIWYESAPGPEHTWQSTGGTDAFEPKLGLMPLIFGTIKATIYSMIFGAPLALLAALYSSEFLKPRLRATLKSIIELMASLPSVVLGFLAALVIAPYVQEVLPGVLGFFFALPFALVLGANIWQLLPRRRAILWSGWQRFTAIFVAIPVAVWAAGVIGPALEGIFFAGDMQLWLDGQVGESGMGGWLLLFLPVSALIVAFSMGRWVNPWLRGRSRDWGHGAVTRAELGKFLAAAVVTLLLTFGLSFAVSGAGFDPRGGYVDTYVQRNALVVGFVMGFAVIPIIYTLAEDALSSVPSHLRLASLGAGATQWQTAVRVIVPTAMSGLFSAVMIGLGRAVGETMIVLMAAGNTAVMDWNIFNGFRTLSANIAVELPEAARDTTHYRVLFLAAFTLFVMTFVLNTFAEVVRLRYRKRAFEL
ncbi:ABC transporter permease subunit [Engelhardtia mirabilis]|uniref:Phosphate transport system permease protein PstC n=1 Tax=Engelhardtia mirabilis TaxID=2528011 RepID=A0A518BSG1_9BACT|nr:Phosphate transport system permease protein PstC [Planctomycetes bacterium Pla133]QDV04243.1 Phosphate transport system permease protein PstC [Planctomycetes bacterium Pla86]